VGGRGERVILYNEGSGGEGEAGVGWGHRWASLPRKVTVTWLLLQRHKKL
jgi:hypothetical protein